MTKAKEEPDGRDQALEAARVLPDEAWADLVTNDRAVYSTRPTAMQRRMPDAVRRVLDPNRLPAVHEELGGVWAAPAQGPATTVLLVLEKERQHDNLNVRVVAFDATGRALGMDQVSSDLDSFISPGEFPLPSLRHPETPMVPPDDLRSLVRAWANRPPSPDWTAPFGDESQGGFSAPVYPLEALRRSPVILARPETLQPETHDPLEVLPGGFLSQIAAIEGANLVALLPDRAIFSRLWRKEAPYLTVLDALSSSSDFFRYELREQDGWMTFRPRSPYEARAVRLNRAALGVALRAIAQRGNWTLDERATYAWSHPTQDTNDWFEEGLFNDVLPGAGRSLRVGSYREGRRLLRLYHTLAPRLPKGGWRSPACLLPRGRRSPTSCTRRTPDRSRPFKTGNPPRQAGRFTTTA